MPKLLFRSTNGQSPAVNLREAFLEGLAPDRGLYFPEKFPRLLPDEIAAFTALLAGVTGAVLALRGQVTVGLLATPVALVAGTVIARRVVRREPQTL